MNTHKNVSSYSYEFENKCNEFEESKKDQNITNLMLGSDIAKKTGYFWENTVYEFIEENIYHFFINGNSNNLKKIEIHDGESKSIIDEILSFFNSPDRERYLKQYTLVPSDSFYSEPNIGHALRTKRNVELNPGKLDLIYMHKDENGKCNISICDIKAALKVKLYHKIQVEIYYEFLESMLNDTAIGDKKLIDKCTISNLGYVWPRATDHPESFERKPIHNFLIDYLNSSQDEEYVNVSLPAGIRYMYPARCEGCIHVDDCIKRIEDSNMELILSPGISEKDVLYLAKNKDLASVKKLSEIYSNIVQEKENSEESKKLIRSCRFFNRMFIKNTKDYNELDEYIKLWKGRKIYKRPNISHPDLSRNEEDVQIFLSAQYEQFSNTIPVFAIYTQIRGKEVSNKIFIAEDLTEKEIEKNFSKFINTLYSELNRAYKKEFSVQIYVEDGIEKYCLEKSLYEYIEKSIPSKNILYKVASVLTWIRSEKTLLSAPNVGCVDISGKNIQKLHESVLCINEITNRLYILHNYISNDLYAICKAFGVKYEKDPIIFNRFNGNIKEAFLYDIYYSENGSNKKVVLEKVLKQKLVAEHNILSRIRNDLDYFPTNENSIDCRKIAKISTFDSNTEYEDSYSDYIDRLKYMTLSESHLNKRQIREPRLHELQESLANKEFIKLEYIGTFNGTSCQASNGKAYSYTRSKNKYYITYSNKPIVKKKSKLKIPIKNNINSPSNDTTEIDKWHLFRVSNRIKKIYRYPALVMERDFYRFVPMWNDEFRPSSPLGAFPIYDINFFKDRRYHWLYEKNKNNNSVKRTNLILVSGIELGKKSDYKDCIVFKKYNDENDLKTWYFLDKLKEDEKIKNIIDNLFDYTPSETKSNKKRPILFDDPDKQKAYESFADNRVSIVIGPPGTGKTFFISKLLLHKCEQNKDKPYRILLTSNSWAAIDNMLKAFNDVTKEDYQNANTIRLDSQNRRDDEIYTVLNYPICPTIVGTTVWQIYNVCYDEITGGFCKNLTFDMIIIDEATQLRAVDALIALSRLKKSGKLLIVGDADQLGSIIRGEYKKRDEKEYLYGSVFEYFYNKYAGSNNIVQINQCRRMNEVITRYLANTLYGDYYSTVAEKSGNSITVSHALSSRIKKGFANKNASKDPFAPLLDPSFQLTVCYIENADYDAYDINDVEISLTADITIDLQKNIINRKNPDTPVDFNTFWGINTNQDDETIQDNENNDNNESKEESGWDINEGMIGIVSPYNKLNEDIQDVIASRYDSLSDKLKDSLGITYDRETISEIVKCSTVDKFQGQERDIIITCYGERDVDSLMLIKDFVYNSNRLNVAMSRAKKKCIIILSEALAKRHQDCYEENDERVIKGTEFICCLKDYMKENTLPDEFGEYKQRDFYFDYQFPEKDKNVTGKKSKDKKVKTSEIIDKKVRIHVYQKGYNLKPTDTDQQ